MDILMAAATAGSTMEWTAGVEELSCLSCGASATLEATTCPACDGSLTVSYPDGPVPPTSKTPPGTGIWRWAPWLPVAPTGERPRRPGGTPLTASQWLGELTGATILVKDEGANPTGSVYDRGCSVATAAAGLTGADAVNLVATGTDGVAAAAAAAAAGLACSVTVPARAPFATKALINVHGGSMTVTGGRVSNAFDAHEAGESYPLAPARTPFRREGWKTLYLDILAQLDWTAPTHLVVPTGTGLGVAALSASAAACVDAGLVDSRPRVVAAQPYDCAPIVAAIERETTAVEPWSGPDTVVGDLEWPDPACGPAAVDGVLESNGTGIAVPDAAAMEAAVRLADRDGLSVGLAGGIGAAATSELDELDADAMVVVVNPSAARYDADLLRSHLMAAGE